MVPGCNEGVPSCRRSFGYLLLLLFCSVYCCVGHLVPDSQFGELLLQTWFPVDCQPAAGFLLPSL